MTACQMNRGSGLLFEKNLFANYGTLIENGFVCRKCRVMIEGCGEILKDEFDFIQSITPKNHYHKQLITGIGDDAARYRTNAGEHQLVCTDTMVEGVHFLRATMPPFAIGWKALASNLSDIAAMGGVPDYYLVSAAFTRSWLDEGVEIYRGMSALADRYHTDLIGGDTVSTHDALVLTVTVIGHISDERRFLRSDARPGDAVLVTGTLGDSAAGLAVLTEAVRLPEGDRSFLIRRHQLPEPQLAAARLLADLPGRAALNDISDGLASEAGEIAEASGVTIVLDYDKLPKSRALSRLDPERQRRCILYGGEDYELLITVPQKEAARYIAAFSKHRLSLTKIGEVVPASPHAPAVFLETGDKRIRLEKSGYNHFRK